VESRGFLEAGQDAGTFVILSLDPNLIFRVLVSVIKIIDSAPIRIIDRISLTQRCHLSIGVPIVQGLARR
jgi:hypothetical protein